MPNTFVINGEILKDFIGPINSTGSWNVILHIDPIKGFYGKITDTANTTLLDIQYRPNAFVSYKCDNPREIGFDVKAFMAITSKIKKGTRKNPAPLVSLDIQEKEIAVSVNGETTNIRILEEKECRRETRTTFEFPEIMTVNYEELVNTLKNAKKINDKSVSLIVSDGILITKSDSIFGDTLVKHFSSCTGVNGWFKTSFTPGLIIDCLKGMYKDIPVTVSTKTDYPIVLRQETEYSHIEYAIAPRISTDIEKRVKKDPVWVQYLYSYGMISPYMCIQDIHISNLYIPPVNNTVKDFTVENITMSPYPGPGIVDEYRYHGPCMEYDMEIKDLEKLLHEELSDMDHDEIWNNVSLDVENNPETPAEIINTFCKNVYPVGWIPHLRLSIVEVPA